MPMGILANTRGPSPKHRSIPDCWSGQTAIPRGGEDSAHETAPPRPKTTPNDSLEYALHEDTLNTHPQETAAARM